MLSHRPCTHAHPSPACFACACQRRRRHAPCPGREMHSPAGSFHASRFRLSLHGRLRPGLLSQLRLPCTSCPLCTVRPSTRAHLRIAGPACNGTRAAAGAGAGCEETRPPGTLPASQSPDPGMTPGLLSLLHPLHCCWPGHPTHSTQYSTIQYNTHPPKPHSACMCWL